MVFKFFFLNSSKTDFLDAFITPTRPCLLILILCYLTQVVFKFNIFMTGIDIFVVKLTVGIALCLYNTNKTMFVDFDS